MRQQISVKSTEAADVRIDLAGIGARSLAFFIDWKFRALLAVAWFTTAAVTTDYLQGAFETGIDWRGPGSLVVIVPALLIYLLYHPVIEIVTRGRTPGKRIVGIRVADANGGPPSISAILIRNVFRVVDSAPLFYLFGLVFGFLNAKGHRLGDLASGSMLVYEEKISNKSLERFSADALKVDVNNPDKQLALDLINRWRGLDQRHRLRLAGRLLERNNISLEHLKPLNRAQRDREALKLLRAVLSQADDAPAAEADLGQVA